MITVEAQQVHAVALMAAQTWASTANQRDYTAENFGKKVMEVYQSCLAAQPSAPQPAKATSPTISTYRPFLPVLDTTGYHP